MMSHSDFRRREDDPWARKVKLLKDVVNGVGFPILVCMWLAYSQYIDKNEAKEQRKALTDVKEVLVSLKVSIDQQNRIMRRRHDE